MTQPAIAIIQARMSSTRLPGKVLKPLAGKPIIWHIVQRARLCRLVEHALVATSDHPSDDALAAYCSESGMECYRGSLNDVLGRYLDVLDLYSHDYCVRITGDCPLIHPAFIDRQIETLAMHDGDMIRCDTDSTLLEGQGVLSRRSLRHVGDCSSHPDDREHVGSRYFAEHPEEFRIIGLTLPSQLKNTRWRLTVDEEADYQLMTKIYDALYIGNPIAIERVIQWLEENPQAAALNREVEHSEINKQLSAKRASWEQYVKETVIWDLSESK